MTARPTCMMFDAHFILLAARLAPAKTGSASAASTAIIAIAASNSIKLNPYRLGGAPTSLSHSKEETNAVGLHHVHRHYHSRPLILLAVLRLFNAHLRPNEKAHVLRPRPVNLALRMGGLPLL